MNVAELYAFSINVEAHLSDMGYSRPECSAHVNWIGERMLYVIVSADHEGTSAEAFKRRFSSDAFTSLDAMLEAVAEFVATLPDPEQVAREAFVRDFGRMLDRARELGLPVAFMNPFEASMQALSENVVTDQRHAAE